MGKDFAVTFDMRKAIICDRFTTEQDHRPQLRGIRLLPVEEDGVPYVELCATNGSSLIMWRDYSSGFNGLPEEGVLFYYPKKEFGAATSKAGKITLTNTSCQLEVGNNRSVTDVEHPPFEYFSERWKFPTVDVVFSTEVQHYRWGFKEPIDKDMLRSVLGLSMKKFDPIDYKWKGNRRLDFWHDSRKSEKNATILVTDPSDRGFAAILCGLRYEESELKPGQQIPVWLKEKIEEQAKRRKEDLK